MVATLNLILKLLAFHVKNYINMHIFGKNYGVVMNKIKLTTASCDEKMN